MVVVRDLPDGDLMAPSQAHIPVFEQLLKSDTPHEADFLLFRNFADRAGLFIDVGANIGNSALSIHLIAPRWEVVSFEPNPSLSFFLSRAQKLLAEHGCNMQFHTIGLGASAGPLDFYIPRVDDWYVIGEASFSLAHFDDPIVSARLASYSSHGQWELGRTRLRIERFDDLVFMRERLERLPPGTEIVVKIDVEGFEMACLTGMVSLIRERRPMFMVEYSGDPKVDALLLSHGYQVFDYSPDSNRLWTNDGFRSLNSLYLPTEKIDHDPMVKSLIGHSS